MQKAFGTLVAGITPRRKRSANHLGRVNSNWHLPAVQQARTARRRWCGLLFLILAGGMTVWGLTWLEPSLRGIAFVLYWIACAGFLLLATLVAGVDLLVVVAEARRERRELLRGAGASTPAKSLKREANPASPPPPLQS
jgi:hypothetical protein